MALTVILMKFLLAFHKYFVSQICKRAGEKYMLYLEYMDQNKRRIFMKA